MCVCVCVCVCRCVRVIYAPCAMEKTCMYLLFYSSMYLANPSATDRMSHKVIF